jgi:C4-dicarboxylate-specific signal transduction histidine kinase
MMVLHNLFFLVLAGSVYFTVIPLVERHVDAARAREFSLLRKVFLEDPMPQVPGMQAYQFREGTAPGLGIPKPAEEWLELHPGQIYDDPQSNTIYRLVPSTGVFRSVLTPEVHYESVLRRAKITIFAVLGILYALAILLLELTIMPRYVYGPIQRFLQADAAVQRGDRQHELIPEKEILDDEIGEIMRSRNATVSELRKQEAELAAALAKLEESAAELKSKNEQLEAARRSLMEQDRLASLGLLSASVAHELNTPLTVLTGSIEKLEETAETALMRDRLARMKRVTQRI